MSYFDTIRELVDKEIHWKVYFKFAINNKFSDIMEDLMVALARHMHTVFLQLVWAMNQFPSFTVHCH
jgi:hypothetical protein